MSRSIRSWLPPELDERVHDLLGRGLKASQLWSLLLDVTQRRARDRTHAELMAHYERDRFVQPSTVDARALLDMDRVLFANAAQFEPIELSPLAPLGSCSTVALTSQNRIVSTVRGTEVVADPSNVLALECVRRLRADPQRVVRLATSHRCFRAQPVPRRPGFAAHFRMFCMASAAHETKDQDATVTALREHIGAHLSGLDALERIGYVFPDRTLTLLCTPERAPLARRIGEMNLRIPVTYAKLEHDYYAGIRFMINAGATHGEKIPLIDGGCFDWLKKLAQHRKLIYVASALGTQSAVVLFRAGAQMQEAR